MEAPQFIWILRQNIVAEKTEREIFSGGHRMIGKRNVSARSWA